MSDEAWLELSHLLVQSTPAIKPRVVNTLRNISPEELDRWSRRLRNPELYAVQPLLNNEFTYVPGARTLGSSNPHQQQQQQHYRYYTGRPGRSLLIKFVDNTPDFEAMLVYMKVGIKGVPLLLCFAVKVCFYYLLMFSFSTPRPKASSASTASGCPSSPSCRLASPFCK